MSLLGAATVSSLNNIVSIRPHRCQAWLPSASHMGSRSDALVDVCFRAIRQSDTEKRRDHNRVSLVRDPLLSQHTVALLPTSVPPTVIGRENESWTETASGVNIQHAARGTDVPD